MIVNLNDRIAIEYLHGMANSEEGRKALSMIARMGLADEIAWQNGQSPEMTAYRCGRQALAKEIMELARQTVDWDELEKEAIDRERKAKEFKHGKL